MRDPLTIPRITRRVLRTTHPDHRIMAADMVDMVVTMHILLGHQVPQEWNWTMIQPGTTVAVPMCHMKDNRASRNSTRNSTSNNNISSNNTTTRTYIPRTRIISKRPNKISLQTITPTITRPTTNNSKHKRLDRTGEARTLHSRPTGDDEVSMKTCPQLTALNRLRVDH